MAGENDVVIAAWNTVLFDKFCRFKHLLIDGLSAHSNEALARHDHPEGARVLDVGCGFGDSTRFIARRVGPRGEAVGVDCVLRSAGYDRIAFERFDADICIGKDVGEAIEFAMALGPAGEIIRLAGEEGEKRKPEVAVALQETLAPYSRADGVWAPSSTWFVTACNP